MTGTIFDIKRFATHDGNGIRTTVFFKGCPLRCVWCHNPEGLNEKKQLGYLAHKCVLCGACAAICKQSAHTLTNQHTHEFDRDKCVLCGECVNVCRQKALSLYGKRITVDELLPQLCADRDFYEGSGGGVTLSGGEALRQSEFCLELLKRLKESGINTAVDTCGFVPFEIFKNVIPYTDMFLFDIKHMNSDMHKKFTGKPNELILSNLKMLCESGASVEIRMPFIPEYNDSIENLNAMGDFLKRLSGITRVKILPYHEYARDKYTSLGMKDTLPRVKMPENHDLKKAAEILRTYGLNAVSATE